MKKQFLYLLLLGLLCSVGNAWGAKVTWTPTNSDVTSLTSGDKSLSIGSGTEVFMVYAIRSGNTPALAWSNSAFKFNDAAFYKSGISIYIPSTSSSVTKIEFFLKNSNSKIISYKALETQTIASNPDELSEQTLSNSYNGYELFTSPSKGVYYAVGGKAASSGGDTYLQKIEVTFADGPDVIAPTLSSSSPANDATDVALSGKITLTFSEDVTIADVSKFSLSGGAGALNTAGAKVSGAVVTIPYFGLDLNTTYTLSAAAGAVQDAAGNTSAALSDISFTTTASSYVFETLVKYALTEGATFTSGQTVDVQDEGNLVATITYGEAGGANFQAAAAEGSIPGFAYRTPGNGTNGNSTGGTWYTIVPKYDAIISVAVKLNSGKKFYVKENNVALSSYNGVTVGTTYIGLCIFKATANKSYKIYCDGSKLGFFGFLMSPYVTTNITSAGWASMYLDFPVEVPTGVTAYYASAVTNSAVTLSPISAGQVIPANTGVVVSGAAGNYDFAYSDEEPVSVGTNYFKGCLVATAVEASTKYVLSPESTSGSCVFGLYTGTTLGAYKAYMDATDRPAGAPDRIQFIIEGENNATNIENIESTDKAVKFIEKGRILILRDGIAYDALGRIVK